MSQHSCQGISPGFDRQRLRQLHFAIILTAVIFVGELVGGLWTGSLALLSDAAHVLSDVFALGLSLFAIGLACRPPTNRHSWGLHRTEVFAALFNGLTLIVISIGILWEAWRRFQEPGEIKSLPMLVVALIGLAVNWLVATRLAGHSHDDLNLRSAYLHVLGDLLASVGVVISALIIHFTGWMLIDPIASALISLLIFSSAIRVTSEAMHILLEGVPRSINIEHVALELEKLPGVEAVHSVQAWSICSNVLVFSGHVVTCPETEAERQSLRRQLDEVLIGRFGFCHTTVELECEPCNNNELLKTFEHTDSQNSVLYDGHDHNHEEHPPHVDDSEHDSSHAH